jgi:hypothetical protein
MSKVKTCAAPGCNAVIPRSHLMCVHHWRKVPPDVQREVYVRLKSWRDESSARLILLSCKRVAAAVRQ